MNNLEDQMIQLQKSIDSYGSTLRQLSQLNAIERQNLLTKAASKEVLNSEKQPESLETLSPLQVYQKAQNPSEWDEYLKSISPELEALFKR